MQPSRGTPAPPSAAALRSARRDPGHLLTAALAVYAALYVLWLLARPGAAEMRARIADLAFIPAGLAVAVLAWRTARHRRLPDATRGAWRLIAAALTLWWLGDVVWVISSAVLGQPPFPSAADVFYLAFYPLMMAGLLAIPGGPQSRVERATFLLDALTVLLGGWMVVWYFVLGPIAVEEGSRQLVTILAAAYPVGDLVLIFGVAAVLLRASSPAERRPLALLGAGGAAFLVADLAFGALSLRDAYTAGDWPDAVWMVAALLFGAAAQAQHRRPSADRPEDRPASAEVRAVSPLPYAAVGLGYLLLLAAGRAAPIYPLGGLLAGAVAITGLVLVRQATLAKEHVRLLAELHALAGTDPLTGLHTRRHFVELAEREHARARRYGRPLAALMLDVDHFKQINDRFGHAAGDAVLRMVAAQLQASLRDIDLVARYGGDEFAALLPESTLGGALDVAERLRARIAASAGGVEPQRIAVTVSVGAAPADGAPDLETVLRRADEALYRAKAAGRNVVRGWTADR